MPYIIPTFDELRDKYLRTVRNLDHEADIGPDSGHFIRASASASLVEGLYHHQQYIFDQIFEDKATPETLEWHAGKRGLFLKKATYATGVLSLTGTPGAAASAGLMATHASGLQVLASNGMVVGGDGNLLLPVKAALAGTVPNLTSEPVLINSAPSGISPNALLTIAGGTDDETYSELLARLLFRMRHPEGGGNKFDFEAWALEVEGVARARCLPRRRGLGTVDVLILGASGLPGNDIITACQAYLENKRPVPGKNVLVLGPLPLEVDLTAALSLHSGSLAEIRPAALNACREVFNALSPGAPLILARLNAALMALNQVKDCLIVSPAANLLPNDIGWPRLGEFELEAL